MPFTGASYASPFLPHTSPSLGVFPECENHFSLASDRYGVNNDLQAFRSRGVWSAFL